MSKILEAIDEKAVIQGLLTVLIWGASVYLIVVGQPVPELLSNAALVIFGYYFGAVTQSQIHKALKGG